MGSEMCIRDRACRVSIPGVELKYDIAFNKHGSDCHETQVSDSSLSLRTAIDHGVIDHGVIVGKTATAPRQRDPAHSFAQKPCQAVADQPPQTRW